MQLSVNVGELVQIGFAQQDGARLAHALPRRVLEIGFGLFLLVVSARFVVSLTG
jgi:uncharacterized membrane protein YfcA